MKNAKYDFVIVGAGFAGIVCAQILAEQGKKILMLEKRNHIGGNAYDFYDENGILVHPYGPHIFHTNSEKVFSYLSRFTKWRFYEHKVLACVDDEYYEIPINCNTINKVFNKNFSEDEVEGFLESIRINKEIIRTSEDVVLSSVGERLCDMFFRGYTKKQWDLDLSELSAGVAARIPTRTNKDNRYFSDKYQFMPLEGYSSMFKRMTESNLIEIELESDFLSKRDDYNGIHVIFTGSVDEYYNYKHGKLDYRSLRFDHKHINKVEFFQETGTINYPNQHAYTRITEFKHLTGQVNNGTSIVYEYPSAEGDPYYPIPNEKTKKIYDKYKEMVDSDFNVSFVGRLAQYKYYNMDQVVASAMHLCEKFSK